MTTSFAPADGDRRYTGCFLPGLGHRKRRGARSDRDALAKSHHKRDLGRVVIDGCSTLLCSGALLLIRVGHEYFIK